jgi:hypothetical protein
MTVEGLEKTRKQRQQSTNPAGVINIFRHTSPSYGLSKFRPTPQPIRYLYVDWGIRFSVRRDAMPDYEIRYFRADGTLALIQITVQPSEQHARDYAQRNQDDHARFELRLSNGPQTRR